MTLTFTHLRSRLLAWSVLITLALVSYPGTGVRAQIPDPTAPAQISQAEIQRELRERGIDETELRARLIQEGIDLNALSQEELIQLRPRIEEIIQQMEAENAAAEETPVTDPAAPPAEPEVIQNPEDIDPDPTPEEPLEELEPSMIYGHDLLRNRNLKVFRGTEAATPPETYPLRPGDEIAVSVFGRSQQDFILRLDPAGFVLLPTGTRIPLGGVSLGDARRLLKSRLKRIYAFGEGELSIRMQVARTINVNIFGEVVDNGTFTMSSLNTGFNALVAAGGPTDRGSVRNIKLLRGEEEVTLDVYEYLNRPAQTSDLFLADGATIFVPTARKVVEVSEGVLRPMFYELKDGETLDDLIEFAGGTLPQAETGNIRVTRYVDGMTKLFNVDLATGGGFALRNGDRILIPLVEEPIEDFVTVDGSVLLPGPYAFEESMTVARLAELARLRPEARRDVGFLFRTNPDGRTSLRRVSLAADTPETITLQRGDRLEVLAEVNYLDPTVIQIAGAVRYGDTELPFPDDGRLTVEEAILLSGGLLPNARPEVMIIRTPITNREDKVYRRVNVATEGDFALEPLDQIQVYSNERYNDTTKVVINGAVRQPGEYTYNPSLSLDDLIYLAGGLTVDAALERVEVFRLQFVAGAETRTLVETLDLTTASDFALQAYDEVVIRSAAEFETIRNVVLTGEVRYPGQYALIRDNERLSDVIERAGGLTPEAFPEGATLFRPEPGVGTVVLELQRVIKDADDPANVVLQHNDTISVPKRRDLVRIVISNTNATAFGSDSTSRDGTIEVAYQGPHSAKWYIDNYAGGYDEDTAYKRGTSVRYANGQIRETKSFLGLRTYPSIKRGATIQVTAKPPERQRVRREERFDWIGLASVIVGAVTSIATIIVISNRN